MHGRFHTAPEEKFKVHLERAVNYIESHYPEDLSLDRLASVAHYSKYHFHRLFHAYYGETVLARVRRTRLEHAARLLADLKNVSVEEIAGRCGFSSSQNFARAFKSHFGHSPTSIRKSSNRQATIAIRGGQQRAGGEPPLRMEIKELPTCRVAYIRDIGPYHSESNRKTFVRLFQWAMAQGIDDPSAAPIAVCWSDPAATPPEECVFDACLPVSESIEGDGAVGIQCLPGGKFAVMHCECGLETLFVASKRLVCEWLPRSSFQRDERPVFFVYYNHPEMNPRKLAIVDVCVPINP